MSNWKLDVPLTKALKIIDLELIPWPRCDNMEINEMHSSTLDTSSFPSVRQTERFSPIFDVTPICVTSLSFSEVLPNEKRQSYRFHDLFFRCFSHNKIYNGAGCCPQLEFIPTDRVICLVCTSQNGPCDEPCVATHPFTDSPLVTHQHSHFRSACLWSPRLKLKISRYNPFLPAHGSSFSILLSSLIPQTLLRTVIYIFVQYNWYFYCMLRIVMHNLFISEDPPSYQIVTFLLFGTF